MSTSASSIALSVAMAAAAGLVGSFAVMRRMTLASDAISHVALPGIGIALALHVHPLLGAAAALLLGTLVIWGLERRTRIATETLIGVVFSTALAAGSLLASGEDLVDALLGSPGSLTAWEAALGIAAYWISPKLGVLALAAPLGVVAVLSSKVGVLAVAAAIPLDPVAGLVPGAFTLTKLLGLVVVAGWLVNSAIRRQPIRLGLPGLCLLAYVIFAALSLAWAVAPSRGMEQLETLVQLFALYVMTSNVLNSDRAIRQALDAYVVVSIVVAVVVLLQFSSAAAFERATLTYGEQAFNPNALAAQLTIPILSRVALTSRSRWASLLRLASVLPVGVAIVATGSRGALVGLLAGMAAITLVQFRFQKRWVHYQ